MTSTPNWKRLSPWRPTVTPEPVPYDVDGLEPDLPAHWATQPRDDHGQFDVPRDGWGRAFPWVDADDLLA